MQLLSKFNTVNDAEGAAALLKAHGIVTHVASHTGTTLNGVLHGVTEVAVWCVLDHQFEDARALLLNDQHLVTTGLSELEMEEFETSGSSYVFRSLNRALAAGVVLIVLLIGALYWMSNNL